MKTKIKILPENINSGTVKTVIFETVVMWKMGGRINLDILSDKIVRTNKKHMCSACGRIFQKGTMMRTQVNTYDGIQTWRECPTCQQLLKKYAEQFESSDNMFEEFCVMNTLEQKQTPEYLLNSLEKPNDKLKAHFQS